MKSSTMWREGSYFSISSSFLFQNALRWFLSSKLSSKWTWDTPRESFRLSLNLAMLLFSKSYSINEGDLDLMSVILSMLYFIMDSMNCFLVSMIDQKMDSLPQSTISRTRGSWGREGNTSFCSTTGGSIGCSSIYYSMILVDYSNVLLYFSYQLCSIYQYFMQE